MSHPTVPDTLHRLVKHALDSGAAASLVEAEAMFRGYRLSFEIGPSEARDAAHQAALLTGVALARRVFLGGVSVIGELDVPVATPLALSTTLGDAVTQLGGMRAASWDGSPLVTIGGGARARGKGFHVRSLFAGWRGGIVPAHAEMSPAPAGAMPLSAMLSAALAVNEAFLFVGRECGAAGRRALGLSLWQPSPACDWLRSGEDEPHLLYLPSQLWLIGLGHLGQAFLWGLGLLPYADPAGVSVVLQDTDAVTPSSVSTSVLCDVGQVGRKKTRVLADWSERRGFNTSIVERLFDGAFRRHHREPPVALCGVDNALGRRGLDEVGFDFVVEAGLGRNHRNFRSMRIHTLPGPRRSADIWKEDAPSEDVAGRAAYQKMLADGELDRCGVTLLAGKAVGAPFVGAVAACLALSEVLRLLHGGPLHQVVDLDLKSIEQRSAVLRRDGLGNFNPGFLNTV
jgi:hypothetical protein